MTFRKLVDDIVYEVDCQVITVKPGADVDIGTSAMFSHSSCPTDPISGGNPSAEETEEALEEGATQVNNVVHSFRLQPTSFDKKSFLAYLKVCLSDK
jgi:Translationally controlled tumour protein